MQNDGHRSTILIIEDKANDLHTMRDYLTRAGFNVQSATDAWEVSKQLQQQSFDVVIAELLLADAGGAEMREKMLLNPDTRDIPFLFLTPKGNSDVLVRALRSGVDDCVYTPVDPVELVARVQAVLERRRIYAEMVRVDPLTRMLNRPALEKEVQEELQRVVRYKRLSSFVLLDIDNFSKINAKNGVPMGDLLLTCLSGAIMSNIRSMDIAGRFLGEKFLICLPETEEEGAVIFAQRIQKVLLNIADALVGFPLTFSCGLLTVPEDGIDFPLIINRLQQTMAHAKTQEKGAISRWGHDVASSATQSA